MLTQFKLHISEKFPKLQTSKLGVAISGGVDSVVLAHLCQQLDIELALLHCNFQLRGDSSNGDQAFVKRLANSWNVPFITTEFNTKAYTEINKVSTQVGARELRYRWFSSMAELHCLDAVLTAHHADDNLETFLINLSRGTGIGGLTGIPVVNDIYIRPMLPFGKDTILAYAKKNNLEWREDASNSDTKYLRNKFRHDVVPYLKKVQPQILLNFNTTIANLANSQEVVKTYVENFKKLFFEEVKSIQGFKISLEALNNEVHSEIVMFEVLKPYGFSAWKDMTALREAQSGKKIVSKTHVLLKDRDYLFLYPKTKKRNEIILVKPKDAKVVISEDEVLFFEKSQNSKILYAKNKIVIDAAKANFPLRVRKWKEGDYFYPAGMQGKKKISKFFKDEKFSVPEKENTWLLCDKDDLVIWIVNHRADRRFEVEKSSALAVVIKYKKG